MFKNKSLSSVLREVNTVASTGTCPRKRVGACLYLLDEKQNNIYFVGSGSNQSLAPMPSCDDVGCDLVVSYNSANTFQTPLKYNCVRTVHAEINAMKDMQYSDYASGYKTKFIMFSNTFPCWKCFKIMVSNGIERIYFTDSYNNDKRIDEYLRATPIVHIFEIKKKPDPEQCNDDSVLEVVPYLPKGEQ